MQEFNVLTIQEYLPGDGLELVITSFASLYHRLTFKHHRKIKLKVVCTLEQAPMVLTLANNHKVASAVELIPTTDFDTHDWSPQQASVLFLPTAERVGRITREALAQGIPIVAFQNESIAEYVDESCGLLVRQRQGSMDVDAFSRVLNMLYFDPEVRKILKKGASKKYKEISGGGGMRVMNTDRTRVRV